jgi:hypothetical protein
MRKTQYFHCDYSKNGEENSLTYSCVSSYLDRFFIDGINGEYKIIKPIKTSQTRNTLIIYLYVRVGAKCVHSAIN